MLHVSCFVSSYTAYTSSWSKVSPSSNSSFIEQIIIINHPHQNRHHHQHRQKTSRPPPLHARSPSPTETTTIETLAIMLIMLLTTMTIMPCFACHPNRQTAAIHMTVTPPKVKSTCTRSFYRNVSCQTTLHQPETEEEDIEGRHKLCFRQ